MGRTALQTYTIHRIDDRAGRLDAPSGVGSVPLDETARTYLDHGFSLAQVDRNSLFDLTGRSREEMIFDKTKLLSVFDMTKDAEPMKTGNPPESVLPQVTEALPVIHPGPAANPERPRRAEATAPALGRGH